MGLFDRLFGTTDDKLQEDELVTAEDTTSETMSSTITEEKQEDDLRKDDSQGISVDSEQTTSPKSSLERAMEILQDKEKRAEAVREAQERQDDKEEKEGQVLATTQAEQREFVEEVVEDKSEPTAFLASSRSEFDHPSSQETVSEDASETTQEKYARTLKKTRVGFGAKLNAFFANFRKVDEDFFEELEEILITSDVGVQVATQLTEVLRQEAKLEKVKRGEDLRRLVIEKLVDVYEKDGDFEAEKVVLQEGLTVILFVGVNGVGKTTSIGKLAHQYKQAGKSVMLVAADTFRAGAVAQLEEWARRVAVPVVTGPEKSDPASVVFDGVNKALAENVDILMIDTAGRLQNKDNLMAELAKIGRIIKRVLPEAPHETLLALDASTGQNALSQAKEFSKITPLTGLVLTKLDGTARGGVVLAIRQELDIPVKLIGFGEKMDDIGQFNSEDFMKGLLEGLI